LPVNRRTVLRASATAAALIAFDVTRAAASPVSTYWDQLRAEFGGTLVLPSDTDYNRAEQLYYAQYDAVRPQAIAYCTSAADVSACVRFARARKIRVTPRSGGHSSAGYSTSNGLVVDMSRLNGVTVGTSTVTVGSGLQQVDGVAALSARGLALTGGLAGTVAAAGYLQGGGFGLLTRNVGMGCDHIVSAEVVLADGTVVHASERQEPDLYWALRGGGGGNFGIVTSFELSPLSITGLVNFTLTWAWEDAAAVLSGWQQWVAAGARESGSQLGIALPDASPGAVPVVSVSGAWSGDPAKADADVDALVSLVGKPALTRRVQPLTYHDAMMEWYGCATKTVDQCHRVGYSPEAILARGTYLAVRSRMFGEPMPAAGIDAALAAFDSARRAGHGRVLSGAAFGGRANDVSRTATAYVHRDTEFSLVAANTLPSGAPAEVDRQDATAWTNGMFAALDPYSNGETYQNFVDPALPDWRTAYYGENYPRLAAVKRQYDPDRFFDFPQAV
jgi:FAD/FMN-containing dehydrogenase